MRSTKLIVITNRRISENELELDDDKRLEYIHNENTNPPYLRCCFNATIDNINEESYESLFELTDTDDQKKEQRIRRLFDNNIPEHAILFVHGFNNSLCDAIITADKIRKITTKDVILFSWPCSYEKNIVDPVRRAFNTARNYAIDSEMATTSVRPLNWIFYFLLDVIENLHVICHSMGSRIVVNSLMSIAHDYKIIKKDHNHPFYQKYKQRISHLVKIIFKQSDIDVINMSKFVCQTLPFFSDIDDNIRTYIYVHKYDEALGYSQKIHGDRPRVGQFEGKEKLKSSIINNVKLTIIDASECETITGRWVRWIPFNEYIHSWIPGRTRHSYFTSAIFRESIRKILAPRADKNNPLEDMTIRQFVENFNS